MTSEKCTHCESPRHMRFQQASHSEPESRNPLYLLAAVGICVVFWFGLVLLLASGVPR